MVCPSSTFRHHRLTWQRPGDGSPASYGWHVAPVCRIAHHESSIPFEAGASWLSLSPSLSLSLCFSLSLHPDRYSANVDLLLSCEVHRKLWTQNQSHVKEAERYRKAPAPNRMLHARARESLGSDGYSDASDGNVLKRAAVGH